ncbi:hypothetical protein [Paenibacillus thermotolerans]|uniref:hypothetical protein n=1 Tax=Paenibacillus thermotolerans TaxID=3027807 RepID=UPI002367F650|nr:MULTISPECIES: hypothetical protein [unclassified Paenibacillus]
MGAKDVSKTMTLKDMVTGTLKKIGAGTVQYKKQLYDLKMQGQQTWSSLANGVRTAATAFSGTAATFATVASGMGINAASGLENYRLTLETVLQDTKKAGDLMKWASQFANITPFETDQVVEGTVRLAAYGIEARSTMGAIGDMAAVMNKDLMQAIEAVADAQTGELERLKEFGITKAMIEKKAGEMYRNQVVVNNEGQIKDQEKFNAALFSLMEERFKGGMEKQASTLKGIWSTVTGTMSSELARMTGVTSEGLIRQGSLFETLKIGAQDLGTELMNLAQSDLKSFDREFVSPIRSWIEAGGIRNTVQGVRDLAVGVWGVFNAGVATYSFFRDNWSTLSPLIYGVTGSIVAYKIAAMGAAAWTAIFGKAATLASIRTAVMGTASLVASGQIGVMTGAQQLLNAAMRANPVGMVIVGIGALIAAGTLLINNWDNVQLAGKKLWNGIVQVAEWGVNAYIKYINGWIKVVLSGVNLIIDGINKIKGDNIAKIDFSLGEVDFSSAKFNTAGQSFDWRLGKKKESSSVDSVISDMELQQEKIYMHNAKRQEQIDSQKNLTDALTANTAATAENTKTVKATLRDPRASIDIADSLLGRIDRHLYGLT